MSDATPSTPEATAPDLTAALARFGHTRFKPGQREAIDTLFEVGRLLLVAPTGGGKSLTYQMPASVLTGTTLVVSPLIALMHDQVTALERIGVAATYLASTLSADESRERFRKLAQGHYDLVYVAPERLMLGGFVKLLADLDCPLVAIDEAHCISEWGHDFRPEYMGIGGVLQALPKARVLACTATATPVVRDEIIERLGLPADTPQIVKGFARPNLSLRAHEVRSRQERNRRVDAALSEALANPGSGKGAAIVYAPTRRGAEEEAERLSKYGWRAKCYHAGLPARERDLTQTLFIDGDLEVVAATNAFGMGIDRADVRAVVHLGPPGSLEAYYQEVGRAGRDDAAALGLLLHAANDFPVRRRLLEMPGDDGPPPPEVVEHKWNLFLELMRWADGGTCRHDAVLRYFGDEEETVGGCGTCDVCAQIGGAASGDAETQDPEEVSLLVRKALSGVARVNGRFGLTAALQLLRGKQDERLARSGLDRVATFGILEDKSEEWLQRLLRRLVTAGWVGFAGGDRPVAFLTDAGRAVMRGDVPPRIILPAERRLDTLAPAKRSGRADPAIDLDPAAQGLFEKLRAWRLDLARSQGVPPYVVAADRTLRDVALLRPRSEDELLLCHGIGPAKARKYGAALLTAVLETAPAE
jgi:ATP-dependent DNA helicase RecQ